MPPKFIAATLTILLGLAPGMPGALAGDAAPGGPGKRIEAPVSNDEQIGRTVFQVLLGEIALQRGDVKLSSDAWSDLAIRSLDPKALARATEIAAFARQYERALELANLWLAADPSSEQARQTQSSLLVLTNRVDQLQPRLAQLLAEDKANIGNNLLQINRMLAKLSDKRAVQELVDKLARPYDNIPEAHFAMAQAAAGAGDNARALAETEQALRLKPEWEGAAIIRAQLQAQQSPSSAIDGLQNFIDHSPTAKDARLTLARLLIADKRYDEARAQFTRLLKDNPDSPEIIYPVAILALQHGDTNTGREQLEHLLQTNYPDKSTIHYYLAQIEQERKNNDAALAHYRSVTAGEQFLNARIRAAQLLAQTGRLDEGRNLLHETRGGTAEEKTQLTLAESQILRDLGRYADALAVLETAIASQPHDTDLLYEAALTADRIGKPDLLERYVRRILAIKPDHAHALNALGYSLAERNQRLPEAFQLIDKALKLSPDDPFIMDSMGWVLYRQGRLEQARQTLEQAFKLRADPEIAAHLGEVLWVSGHKDDARRVLKDAFAANPDNETLAATIKKYQP